jgi:hypothetical protein
VIPKLSSTSLGRSLTALVAIYFVQLRRIEERRREKRREVKREDGI